VLQKPFRIADLERAVRSALNTPRSAWQDSRLRYFKRVPWRFDWADRLAATL